METPDSHSRESSMTSVLDEMGAVEQSLFKSINQGDREGLSELLNDENQSDAVLKAILTTVYSNDDNFYAHDEDVLQDADALLGLSTKNLNAIQIACMLGDEDIALELLHFVERATEELESKKLLLEFVGRVWGAANTVLHLASFLGMADLVKSLLLLGANPNKRNDRQLRPVDCADDDKTLYVFSTIVVPEVPRLVLRSTSSDESFVYPPLKTVNSFDETLKKPKKQDKPKESINEPADSHLNDFESKDQLSHPSPKRARKIQFDPVSTLLYFCQYGEQPDYFNQTSISELARQLKNELTSIKTGHQSLSVLHVACTFNQIAVVEYLLKECEFPVNLRDKEGWTPLHCACVEGNVEIVEMLCRCQGSSVNSKRDHSEWIYVQDGPIELMPLNEDKEKPEDLIVDKRPDETRAVLKAWKRKFPQEPVPFIREEEEDEDVDTSEDSLEDQKLESPVRKPASVSKIPTPIKLSPVKFSLEELTQSLSPTGTLKKNDVRGLRKSPSNSLTNLLGSKEDLKDRRSSLGCESDFQTKLAIVARTTQSDPTSPTDAVASPHKLSKIPTLVQEPEPKVQPTPRLLEKKRSHPGFPEPSAQVKAEIGVSSVKSRIAAYENIGPKKAV